MTNAGAWRRTALGTLGVVMFLSAWEAAARFLGGPGSFVPPPTAVVSTLVEQWHPDELGANLRVSLVRVALGFFTGATLGTSIGLITGWSRLAARTLYAPLDMARYVPALAWVPLAILWLGLGEASKIFLVSLGAFFQCLVGTYAAVRRVDPALLRAAQSLGCGEFAVLRRVVVPAVLPELATALRVGMTLSYIIVVGAELLGADSGLGYVMMLGREDDRPQLIFASLALFAASNLATEAGLRRVFGYLLRWHAGLERVRT